MSIVAVLVLAVGKQLLVAVLVLAVGKQLLVAVLVLAVGKQLLVAVLVLAVGKQLLVAATAVLRHIVAASGSTIRLLCPPLPSSLFVGPDQCLLR